MPYTNMKSALGAVVYYVIVPTVGGYLLWYAGAARVSGTEASLFAALAPVSGLVLAVVLLNEHAGWQQYVGAACGLAAIVLPLCRRVSPAPMSDGKQGHLPPENKEA